MSNEHQLSLQQIGEPFVWLILIGLAVVWIGGGLVSGLGAWLRMRGGRR